MLSLVHEENAEEWQREWEATNKVKITRSFFPIVSDHLAVNLELSGQLTMFLTGHGKLNTYFHLFKINDDPSCSCNKDIQTVNHLIWECELLNDKRQILRTSHKSWRKVANHNDELIKEHFKSLVRFFNISNYLIMDYQYK